MNICPNKNSQFWKDLVIATNEPTAWRIWAEFGQRIEEIESVSELLKAPLAQKVVQEDSAKILRVIDNQIASLENQISSLRRGRNSANSTYSQAKINQIQKTIADTIARKESLEYSRSVAALVDGALTDLQEMDEFVSNKANRANSKQWTERLLQYKTFIEDHAKIAVPSYSYGRKVFIDHANQASSLISKLTRDIQEEIENFVQDQVADRTTNKKLIESPEELAQVMKETTDLSLGDTYLADIHSSPDTLLSNFGKIWREALQVIKKNTDSFDKRIKAAGNKLAKFNNGKADFSFMLDGSNYVTRSSSAYKDEDSRIVNEGKDENGITLEYFKIVDPTKADPKKVEHNIRLQGIKSRISEWKAAENINEDGVVSDGENHKFTDEFKEARNNFEELTYTGKFWKWTMKEGVDPEAYAKFKMQYYQDPVSIWVAVTNEDGPTGAVYLTTQTFPKNEFVEVTDKHVSPKYKALQEDNSSLGKARKEFYDMFIDEFENGILSKLPESQKRRMKGRLPSVRANNVDQLTSKGVGVLNVVSKSIRNYFSPDAFTNGRMLDAQGFASRDIPLFYTSNLKDQTKIDKLVKERDLLNKTDVDFKRKYEELNNKISVESKKLEVGELETDLVESLIKFNSMAENYFITKGIESTALAFKDVIESRTYIKGKNKEKVVGATSNTAKSFNNFLNFIMYQDPTNESGLIGTAAQRLQQITSIKGLALAPFSAANNYIIGRIQQKVEAVGGQFVSQKNYISSRLEFNKEYLPNLMKELRMTGDGPYKEYRPYSKFSALVKEFNFVSGKHESSNLNSWLFVLQNGGEFINQTPFGIGIIKDTIVKDADGKNISLYDAYDYSEATGELKLKKGINFTQRQKTDLSNTIRERLSFIHGKYSPDEQTILQSHWVGKLAMQFHRYIYTNFKSRFKERYYDEATSTEVEGRYRTTLAFIKDIKTFGLDFKANYNSQDELGKANLRKTLAEIVFFVVSYGMYGIFKHLKDSIDPDDENMRAFIGFFESQTQRQASEIGSFLSPYEYIKLAKNPLPVIKTVESGLEMISNTAKVPYNILADHPEANYYSSGVNKGKIKFIKNAQDFMPGLRVIGQINNLSQEHDYFK